MVFPYTKTTRLRFDSVFIFRTILLFQNRYLTNSIFLVQSPSPEQPRSTLRSNLQQNIPKLKFTQGYIRKKSEESLELVAQKFAKRTPRVWSLHPIKKSISITHITLSGLFSGSLDSGRLKYYRCMRPRCRYNFRLTKQKTPMLIEKGPLF